MTRKCALKVRMARSDILRRWTSESTSWNFSPPLLFDGELAGCTAFVVKDLEVNTMAAFSESDHDSICGGEAVAVVTGLKWLHQDDIGVHMV